jgi:hypothetical protein
LGHLPGNDKPSTCDLNKINFSWIPQTSYSDFFLYIKNYMTKLSAFEIKNIYKFLDNKSYGYFTNNRWNNFYNLFVSPFIKNDSDNDCLLNEEELKSCFSGEDMNMVETYMPEEFDIDSLVQEIIFSLDNKKSGGINLNNYLLLKKIIIGFRQYHVSGFLDKETFFSSVKTTFVDKNIDEMDSEISYRIAISLMYEKIKDFQINFIQYFEICRLMNSFLSYGVGISDGFITRDQLMTNYQSEKFPNKLNNIIFEKYFSLFDDDKSLNINLDTTQFDPNTIRFEDLATLEFWANIFIKHIDTTENIPCLNITGFKDLFEKERYVRKKYWVYIAYSNFEDYSKINDTSINPTNITDFDFLNNFENTFLETYSEYTLKKLKIKKNNLRKEKFNLRNKENLYIKDKYQFTNKDKFNSMNAKNSYSKSHSHSESSVFDKFNLQDKLNAKSGSQVKSVFDLKLNDEDSKSDKPSDSSSNITGLLDQALDNYFYMLDLNFSKFMTFDEFIIFIKYLRIFERLNKNNYDKRGVIKSNCVNCKYFYKFRYKSI